MRSICWSAIARWTACRRFSKFTLRSLIVRNRGAPPDREIVDDTGEIRDAGFVAWVQRAGDQVEASVADGDRYAVPMVTDRPLTISPGSR